MRNHIVKILYLLFVFLFFASAPVFCSSSAEKAELRKILLKNPEKIEAGIKLGILIAEDIATSSTMDFAAEAESALQLLEDKAVTSIFDIDLRRRAFNAKAVIYNRLLMPKKAGYYLRLAEIKEETSAITNPSFMKDLEIPYQMDFGISFNTPGSTFFPFIGTGLVKSAFSSNVSASAGLKYFTKGFQADLRWVQSIIPDFCLFNYDFLEYYASAGTAWNINGNLIRLNASAGKKLYSTETGNYYDLEQTAFNAFGINESVTLELMLYTNGLNKISAEINGKLMQVPGYSSTSWQTSFSVPFSFDFVSYEFGFLPRFYFAGVFKQDQKNIINIGKRHFIYENAIMIGEKNKKSLFYKRYEISAAVDGVFRLFAFFLPSPADRIYIALNAAAGCGYDSFNQQTDLLYYGGLSAGFDLNDNIPFELRFGMDQDGEFFTYMTVRNRISHNF